MNKFKEFLHLAIIIIVAGILIFSVFKICFAGLNWQIDKHIERYMEAMQ